MDGFSTWDNRGGGAFGAQQMVRVRPHMSAVNIRNFVHERCLSRRQFLLSVDNQAEK
jgi:hypothetical protein